MSRGGLPLTQAPGALKFKPQTRLKPLGQAIQHALFRIDKDGRTRLEKLGERLVRDAVGGDNEAAKIVFDRFEGKVVALDDKGADSENTQAVLLGALVEALVDKKLGNSAKVIEGGTSVQDVVGRMVERKRKT